MSDGAEILSGALGHGAVATLPDIPYLEWSFDYEEPTFTDGSPVRNNTETFLEACEKLHTVFQRFASTSKGYDDGTSGVDFDSVKEKVFDLLFFQHGNRNDPKNGEMHLVKRNLEFEPERRSHITILRPGTSKETTLQP